MTQRRVNRSEPHRAPNRRFNPGASAGMDRRLKGPLVSLGSFAILFVAGEIALHEHVLGMMGPQTKLIPGHGPVMGYEDFADYIDMLETIASRIDAMIDAGMSLEDVLAADPTAGFDERYGDPGRLINRAYMSLSR